MRRPLSLTIAARIVGIFRQTAIGGHHLRVVPTLSVGSVISVFVCTVVKDLNVPAKEVMYLPIRAFVSSSLLHFGSDLFRDRIGLRVCDLIFFHSGEHGIHVTWAVDRWDRSIPFDFAYSDQFQ